MRLSASYPFIFRGTLKRPEDCHLTEAQAADPRRRPPRISRNEMYTEASIGPPVFYCTVHCRYAYTVSLPRDFIMRLDFLTFKYRPFYENKRPRYTLPRDINGGTNAEERARAR